MPTGIMLPMSNTPSTLAMWQRVSPLPLGKALFSTMVCFRAPYFRTALPYIRVLEPGHCEITAPHWWGVKNHIGTFHAIAACNLAEAAMGMLAEATVPSTHRWIPKGMRTQYLAKSQGGLRAVARLDPLPDLATLTEGCDVVVPVELTDRSGAEVVHADITIWVSPKPTRS